jgi:asparagine synthase (glutamine-hydrolysing)
MSDRTVGMFLSGGVDSSLIAAIAQNIANKNNIILETFSVGLKGSPDLENAQIVAKHINTKHHEVVITIEDAIMALNDTIKHLESYDITTIRASVPQYLLSKYIKENTDVTVILSGEGADEILGGYLYFHYAPNNTEFMLENERLLKNLYQYDVLRTDRTTAAHGLEVRVPFLDKEFLELIYSLPSSYKVPMMHNDVKKEKFILRNAYSNTKLLPDNILWRKKDAFSDAVGYNWVDSVKKYADEKITDNMLCNANLTFPNNPPLTKEAYLYRSIFESNYAGCSNLITNFWMPKWISKSILDPSATYLNVHGHRTH